MPRLAQPVGSTSIEVNKQSIARYFGVKQSEVIYFAAGVDLGGYKVIYDKAQQRAYSLPAGISAGTTATSLSSAGVLVHSAGSVDLGVLAVSREEFVTLPGTFSSGTTINTHNELLTHDGLQYRWEGTLPKVVPAASTPASTGGISEGAWQSIGSVILRQQLSDPDGATLYPDIQMSRWRDEGDVRGWGAVGDGVTDDTDALRAAFNSGKRIRVPKGDYYVTGELEIVTAGQIIEFENTGGYGYGENVGLGWTPNTRIMAHGTFASRVRTRRTFRGSASDPQDAALSVVINIQAEGVTLLNPCVWLYCNYADASPSNLGDSCDVGIFVGTRVGTQIHNPQVIGYFRKAGLYFDVSGSSNMPRFYSLAGTPYPAGTARNGGDGTHIWNPYIRGPRVGLAILGALPKTGQTGYSDAYYDEILGAVVTDGRGSFGFSDFACFGGRIYGPDHHSNYRLQDPTLSGGSLNVTSLAAEPEFSPAAVWIDGLAGNASGNLWGMRFFGCRIASFEAFRMRLGAASRVMLTGVHIEGRSGGRFNTSGMAIDTNDYTLNSYGDVSGLPRTNRVVWLGSVRQIITDGAYNHFYGSANTLLTDSGRHFVSDYITTTGSNLDLRAAESKDILFRVGTTSVATLDETGVSFNQPNQSMRFGSGEADIRAASGSGVRLRSGSTTLTITDSTRHAPGSDNSASSGTSGARWSVVYAATATISTSDGRLKTELTDVSDVEKSVAIAIKGLIRKHKFTDAVQVKGDNARWHFGVIAQEVAAAFTSAGLNPNEYGLFCYDEWDDEYDVDGTLVKAAGNRYGLRYEELLCFIIAAM